MEYSDDYYNKESSIVLKKIKAETFIKAFDHLNDKIHYAAKNGLISLNEKKLKKAIISKWNELLIDWFNEFNWWNILNI